MGLFLSWVQIYTVWGGEVDGPLYVVGLEVGVVPGVIAGLVG
jgi:hypothetical protein